jgi:hypothetical protein
LTVLFPRYRDSLVPNQRSLFLCGSSLPAAKKKFVRSLLLKSNPNATFDFLTIAHLKTAFDLEMSKDEGSILAIISFSWDIIFFIACFLRPYAKARSMGRLEAVDAMKTFIFGAFYCL